MLEKEQKSQQLLILITALQLQKHLFYHFLAWEF